MKKLRIKVRKISEGLEMFLHGREAWAMKNLITAGWAGCTPIDQPGPRWSHYVFKLRGYGFLIETVHEAHTGPFPGHHARYILRTAVEILDDGKEAA